MTNFARLRRVPLASALLGAAAIAAFAAALEPRIGAGHGPIVRLLYHDASASCGARETPDEDEIAALLDGLGSDDRVASLSFADGLFAVVGQCAPSQYRAALTESLRSARRLDPHGSTLFAFIRGEIGPKSYIREQVSAGWRLEMLVATDGLITDAYAPGVREAEASLRDLRCASFRVIRRESAPLPSVVAELRGPGAARVGEPFALEARGVATTDDEVVELSDATHVVETRRVGAKGPFRLVFTRIEETTGPVSFTARIAGPSDIPPPVARVGVTSPGQALVVGAAPREIPGVQGTWRDAGDLRDDAAAVLAAHDVVVLDDVDARVWEFHALDEALVPFVERGGGVVLLGGAHSFGAGGWAGRSMERISPLVARPRDEPGTFLYLALDGSGSMAQTWSDTPGAVTRDAATRGAAHALVRFGAAGTQVALRRFAGDLVPAGVAPQVQPITSIDGAIDALPPPGGSTALLPPLREALSLASSRSEKRRAALFLTDGRTPETAADLHAALVALDAANVRVTFVLPGDGALDDEARALQDALAGTRAEVRGATSPERLAEIFRDVEEKARVGEPVVTDRRLLRDSGAAGLVDAVPDFAARVDRVWLADGATQLVVTDRGEPVAALRRVGLGTVAALATRPGDADWLTAGETTARLVTSLVRAAARPASGGVRVERDGDARLLIRYEPPPGGDVPTLVEFGGIDASPVRAPLLPAAGGLAAVDLRAERQRTAEWVDLLASDGRVLATVGLDTPAPAEYRDPPAVDLDALAALASVPDDRKAMPLAPWLAAASVALAVATVAAARIKSLTGLAR